MNPLETLVAAGTLAPSGDNTQPWTFTIDGAAGEIRLRVNPARDPSPMNAGQRMARVALGAATENILRTARFNDLPARLTVDSTSGDCVVVVQNMADQSIQIDPVLRQRVTNRRLYDGGPIADATATQLQAQTPAVEEIHTFWIFDRSRLPTIAGVITQADARLFGCDAMRTAFFANVRFDQAPDAAVAEGLSLASLELSGGNRFAFRLLRRMPGWLFRGAKIQQQFAIKTRQLVESAAGLCLITAPDDSPATDIQVGRAMLRAWLALTEAGCAVQPMMSLPVLDGAAHFGITGPATQGVPELIASLRSAVAELSGGRPAALLRFGYAPPPDRAYGPATASGFAQPLMQAQPTSHKAPRPQAADRAWRPTVRERHLCKRAGTRLAIVQFDRCWCATSFNPKPTATASVSERGFVGTSDESNGATRKQLVPAVAVGSGLNDPIALVQFKVSDDRQPGTKKSPVSTGLTGDI